MDEERAAVEAALEKWAELGRLNRGAVAVRLMRALDRLASNLLDPNTDAEARRELAVKLTFTPSRGSRHTPTVDVTIATKLAGETSEITSVRVVERPDGVTTIIEDPAPSADPRQAPLFEGKGSTLEVLNFNKRKAAGGGEGG